MIRAFETLRRLAGQIREAGQAIEELDQVGNPEQIEAEAQKLAAGQTETAVRRPRVQAEALLKRVLPEESYLEFAAEGACWIDGQTNRYQLRRGSKTIVEKPDKTQWSACIQLEADAPEQDRLVAEYLLIVNDENRYLETANLTQVHTERGRYYHPGPIMYVTDNPAHLGVAVMSTTNMVYFSTSCAVSAMYQGNRWL